MKQSIEEYLEDLKTVKFQMANICRYKCTWLFSQRLEYNKLLDRKHNIYCNINQLKLKQFGERVRHEKRRILANTGEHI